MGIINGILMFILILLSIALTVVVTMQTPKSEGFGGGVANTPGGSFRGKAGYDEMLSGYTRIIAIGWFVTAFLLAVVGEFLRTRPGA
jgi:protein translocase SecG subunit